MFIIYNFVYNTQKVSTVLEEGAGRINNNWLKTEKNIFFKGETEK